MSQQVRRDINIVVIGAGVIGLQIVHTLLEEGYRVLIIADQLPGDTSAYYTSPWAGAQWRSHSAPDDKEQQSWDQQSYLRWKQICFDEQATNTPVPDRSGLVIYPANLIYKDLTHRDLIPSGDPKTSDGFWFRDFVDNFESKVSSGSVSVRYASVFIDVPLYLENLHLRIKELGGTFVRASVPEHRGLAFAVDAASKIARDHAGRRWAHRTIVINATGLRARQLCADAKVYPVRGQVLVVKGVPREASTRLTRNDKTGEPVISYAIPRPLSGVTILGGCQQKDNWSTDEDVQMTTQIKERCASLVPELLTGPGGTFEVIGCQVGLRPARVGGARVESEAVRGINGAMQWVIHAYGHGGAGFQNSIGVARKVSRLVAEIRFEPAARL